jgi:beta-glucosidase-like glycosyl hydrolase
MPVLNEKDARLLLGRIFTMRLPRDPRDLDLDRFPLGNYIVFRDALRASFEDSRQQMYDAKSRIRRCGVEPVFMMDEEGGRVTQISDFFPSAPSAAAVSEHLGPADARVLYRHMSETLADLGIDINLAPCVDVNTEPMNPIIGCRAFGSEPETVAHYGKAFIEASRQHTRCVAKHFPGHGMTTVDSHLDMPVVNASREDLESIHIPPFRAAARAGADGIMISHCHYDALEAKDLPASLSGAIIRDLLRGDLGFDGLVITDSLDMDAVTRNSGAAESSRAAFDAGVDNLLYTENSARFQEAFESMTADLVSGRLDRARLMESISRRQALLDRTSSDRPPKESVSRQCYLELRERVMAASVRTEDPRGLLPLGAGELACITTDHGLLEKTRPYKKTLREIGSAEEARGKVLILWLMEPLRLKHSVEAMRRMIDASQVSVLVTSYRSLADTLSTCGARIVTVDTSPETQAGILHRLLGELP